MIIAICYQSINQSIAIFLKKTGLYKIFKIIYKHPKLENIVAELYIHCIVLGHKLFLNIEMVSRCNFSKARFKF